ncbi:unnamed protein product [Linum trigynum]|uniref:Uncharacterized protein n=1 Tax=Linum trigynum TaxID=586398 RepID=A0AAV2DFW2_9ROSI
MLLDVGMEWANFYANAKCLDSFIKQHVVHFGTIERDGTGSAESVICILQYPKKMVFLHLSSVEKGHFLVEKDHFLWILKATYHGFGLRLFSNDD